MISFDALNTQYHNEVIYKAAINWWWDQLGKFAGKHSTSLGQASQNVGEKWDRALQMIEKLEEQYQIIQSLGTDIYIGNFSRFSKTLLERLGGEREEESFDR